MERISSQHPIEHLQRLLWLIVEDEQCESVASAIKVRFCSQRLSVQFLRLQRLSQVLMRECCAEQPSGLERGLGSLLHRGKYLQCFSIASQVLKRSAEIEQFSLHLGVELQAAPERLDRLFQQSDGVERLCLEQSQPRIAGVLLAEALDPVESRLHAAVENHGPDRRSFPGEIDNGGDLAVNLRVESWQQQTAQQ